MQPGTKVQLPGVDWGGSDHTLVLALSTGCHFCSESAGFYQRLAREKGDREGVRTVAVLPQPVAESREYLSRLGVAVDDVRQSPLTAVGARGTPTLILLDGNGVVQDSWVGKLPPEKEAEVLSRLKTMYVN